MKTKTLSLLEIAVVLCSVFLVALPGLAAEQTTQKVSAREVTIASEDDYVLDIYGNANEDDTIDMRDYTYTARIICWLEEETDLADANYDGRISVADMTQIGLIILGRENELTIVDAYGDVTLDKPIESVVITFRGQLEIIRTIGASDKIVGVDESAVKYNKDFFPEFTEVPTVGIIWDPDIEAILELYPDIVMLYAGQEFGDVSLDVVQDNLEAAGLTVLRFTLDVSDYPEEITKFGYIFDKRKEAEEYLDWCVNILNTIKERVEEIPEEDRPKVYFEWDRYKNAGLYYNIGLSGGKDIFADQPVSEVGPEEVIERDPEIIIHTAWEQGITDGYGVNVDDTADLEEIREEIMNRPELKNVKAVKDGKVYIISGHFTFGHNCGKRDFMRILYFAKWFHPDLFEDLDPKAIHQEYLTRFQGLDIDLDEKGVFVYPEEPI